MKIFKSELIGTPIFYEDILIGIVKNLVIDNANGGLLALSLDKHHKKIVPFDRVYFFMNKFFAVEKDPVFESKDILKIDKIVRANLNLHNQKVIDLESNEYLGYLEDFSLNILMGTVYQLKVKINKFFFFSQTKLIDVNNIYQIEPEIIYVKTGKEKISIKQKKTVPVLDTA